MAQITLSQLAHSYLPSPKTDDDFALKEIDYAWDDGGAYALLGPSGCGKTTLLNIISGLLVPSKGKILFDGQDSQDFTLESLRNQISLVPQQPELFHRSVRDNIVLNNDISDDQLVAAAKKSGSLAFMSSIRLYFPPAHFKKALFFLSFVTANVSTKSKPLIYQAEL